MSIIEKAAGRLEHGKDNAVPQAVPTATVVQAPAHSDTAVLHPTKIELNSANISASDEARHNAVPSDRPATDKRNHAEIDIEQLRSQGMVTPDAERTAIAEEFRLIKRPLLEKAFGKNVAPAHHANLIMVASSLPGEGKTFCAVNLAISIALELDHTVLLVDADVARPSVPRYLSLRSDSAAPDIGLMDVLLNDKLDLADAILRTNIDTLSILKAGSSHKRTTELLASQSMSRLLDEISTRYSDRIVIFDSPPLLLTTEARVLASQMGQIVLIVEAEATTQHAVKSVLRQLKSSNNVNLIFNKAKTFSNGDYYGRYYYS